MRINALIIAWSVALISVLPFEAGAIDASNRYRSPRNPERRVRESTELIVLHTTEAPAKSSLNKLSERGEAHFCVTENGSIYRIVDRDKEAFHAGRSMWNGKEDVDKFSIGIECVGYHNKPMPEIQLKAIRDLVKELKSMYNISDDRVVCHSHVAYGAPNKWQKRNHRGRKRCGMLFAMPSVRNYLELSKRPTSDRDVRAKRLIVGDKYLQKVLYGREDTMKAEMAKLTRTPPEDKSGIFSWLGKKPKGQVPKTVKDPKSVSELVKGGYRIRGHIDKKHTAIQLVGEKWNSPTTYYTIRNKVIPGHKVDAKHLEIGMQIWTK